MKTKQFMKKIVFVLLLVLMTGIADAFEGNDDNVTRDYYVQLYKAQEYIPDFNLRFPTETEKRDYKRIRDYLNNKEEILRVLRMAGDEYYYGLSFSKLYATDYVQSFEDELRLRDPNDKILLRINSVRPTFNYSGEYMVSHIETDILPVIRERYREAATLDSINEITYMQIQKNVEAIKQDVFQAEQAIFMSLSPECRDQDFRIWISLTFSGLIAVILISFFLIIYSRSDSSLYKQLLSSAGLQFVTVFVLIIAIILFGILNILGGSELAAILSGISGYILGKGGSTVASMISKENDVPTPQKSSDTLYNENETVSVEQEKDQQQELQYVTVLQKKDTKEDDEHPKEELSKKEVQEEEEKYFPGGSY